jgi:hypothetical protein
VGLNSLKSLNLTNVYPNNNKNKKKNNNKVKSKPLELYELAGKNLKVVRIMVAIKAHCGGKIGHFSALRRF